MSGFKLIMGNAHFEFLPSAIREHNYMQEFTNASVEVESQSTYCILVGCDILSTSQIIKVGFICFQMGVSTYVCIEK